MLDCRNGKKLSRSKDINGLFIKGGAFSWRGRKTALNLKNYAEKAGKKIFRTSPGH